MIFFSDIDMTPISTALPSARTGACIIKSDEAAKIESRGRINAQILDASCLIKYEKNVALSQLHNCTCLSKDALHF